MEYSYLMDDLFEFIFEFLFEFGSEVSKDKKVSKWIRYPLIILLAILFLGVIGVVVVAGIAAISTNFLVAFLFFTLAIFLFIGGIYKFRKEKIIFI